MRQLILFGGTTLVGLVMASFIAAENTLHMWRRPVPQPSEADALARGTDSQWQPARMAAPDGAVLQGWLFTPLHPNGSGAILLHGVEDNRLGMQGLAAFLLRDGYTVLMPDSRGHGVSGGPVATYGIKEASDVHAWADWLFQMRPIQGLYGLGASMGAAILLESLRVEPRFRAVVADSPFARFEEIAYDRLAQIVPLPRPLYWPLVNMSVLYARARYGVDLQQASPAAVVRTTKVPVLLIHGGRDTNIPIRHSRELHALNPVATHLWEVPEAEHVLAHSAEPEGYERRVLEWFHTHR